MLHSPWREQVSRNSSTPQLVSYRQPNDQKGLNFTFSLEKKSGVQILDTNWIFARKIVQNKNRETKINLAAPDAHPAK